MVEWNGEGMECHCGPTKRELTILTSCRPFRLYLSKFEKERYPSSIHDENVVIDPAIPGKLINDDPKQLSSVR